MDAPWPIGLGAGFVIRRSRVQILLPATRCICVWWSQIQLLHALLIANWSASCQLGFLASFCFIYSIVSLQYFSVHNLHSNAKHKYSFRNFKVEGHKIQERGNSLVWHECFTISFNFSESVDSQLDSCHSCDQYLDKTIIPWWSSMGK